MRPLGAGGMGRVFLAEDTRLHRRVALKVLQSEPGADTTRNILREARAAARLNHPGIAAVHDVLEEGGYSYIVMEYVEGDTLGTLLAEGPLTVDKTLDIGRQLAEALAFAHAHGVVHRDVKPGNVIVTPNGRVKLLDLGLAKVGGPGVDGTDRTTSSVVLAGTPPYMAPEQLFGAPSDASADIYATGVILFELLTGRRPFDGDDFMAVATAVSSATAPPSVTALRPDVPAALASLTERALARDRRQRPASADVLARELGDIQRALSSSATALSPPALRRRVPRAFIASAVCVALVAAAIVIAVVRKPPPHQPGPIAILPALNVAADPRLDSVGTGLVTLLTENLATAPALTIVPATASAAYRGPSRSLAKAAQDLGALYLLDLDLQPDGRAIRLQARFLKRYAPEPLWSGTYSGYALDIQRRLLTEFIRELERLHVVSRSLTDADRLQLLKLPTENETAFGAYAEARFLLDSGENGKLDDAVATLGRAVVADDRFALAHAALSEAYARKYVATRASQWLDLASSSAARALELEPRNGSVHTAVARVHVATGRTEEALRHLRLATEFAPGGDDAYRLLGRLLATRGDLPGARAALRRAIELRPDYWVNHYELGFTLLRAGQYEDAAVPLRRVTELRPDYASGFQALGTARHYVGDVNAAIGYYEHALRLGASPSAYANLGFAYYAAGRAADALPMYLKAIELDPMSASKLRSLGDVYARLGKRTEARQAYERALAAADAALKVNPRDARQIALAAICEMKLGQREPALRHAAESVALAPQDNDVLFKAAAVYALAGKRLDATEALRRAIDLGYPLAIARADEDVGGLAASMSSASGGAGKGADK